jgi:hypothetical protein
VLNDGLQTAGNAIGDGLEGLVGDEHAHASAVDFDNGDYLGGVGQMAEGAAGTIGGAVESGVSALGEGLGSALGDLFGSDGSSSDGSSSDGSGSQGASDGGADMSADATQGDTADDSGYDPSANAGMESSY